VRSDGKEYLSISAAAQDVSVHQATVQAAVQHTLHRLYRTAAGYQWAYVDEFSEVWPKKPAQRKKPVVNSNGVEFASLAEAAHSAIVHTVSISVAAMGTRRGLYRTAGGLQWAYAGEVPEVWPVKQVSPKVLPKVLPKVPIYPPEFTEKQWRIIPILEGFEVSTLREVREIGAKSLLPRVDQQGISLVRINDHFYSVVFLMMLTFMGPKPHGYIVKMRDEDGPEVLFNLYYAPRKPRTTKEEND